MAETATAAYWAQRKDADDESTLLGSHIVSVHSMEYSTLEGASMGGDSSIASSVFQGDRYFQEAEAPSSIPADWSRYNENSNEKRGREFAKKLLKKKSTKRKMTGFLQRALFPFRHRHKGAAVHSAIELKPTTSSSVDDCYSEDDSIFEEEENKLEPSVIRDLDEISDCVSEMSSYEGLEVWQVTSDEESNATHDRLKCDAQQSTEMWRRYRDLDLLYPEGLFVRTSADELIDKLQLGSAGRSAIRRLDEATAAAKKSFDPSQCGPANVVPTLVTVAGYAVPDYSTYVRQNVYHFCKHVLKISDDLYELIEKQKAKGVLLSKLRLLPFAVELYCLEKLMMKKVPGEKGSI